MPDQRFVPSVMQLRVFLAVAERLHFRSAAEDLRMSQPSLSQALATLEEGLGLHLVERSTRSVLITPAGQQILPYARAAVVAMDAVADAAAGSGGPLFGQLRIGVIPTAAPYLLPGLLPALAEEFPDLRPRIVEDQTARLVEGLRSGVIDVAIMALPTDATGIAATPLYSERFALLVPSDHELAGRSGLSPDVLVDQPLLLLDEGHCLREQTVQLCRQVSAPVLGREESRAASLATAVHCVAGGLGVTIVPESAVGPETRGPGIGVAWFADPSPGRTMGLFLRTATGSDESYAQLGRVIIEVAQAVFGAQPV
ncbi:MAG: hydrogen peroxide-inducible genes activator [Actinomycetales bacterium]|nr:hydrogen peroxide-inducible genes activator [Actinomycetales bacterium]